jgi:phosphoserine phosphatase
VNEKLPPVGRELYEKLKATDKKQFIISGTTYRLSVTQKDSQFVPKGTEYLQRWT